MRRARTTTKPEPRFRARGALADLTAAQRAALIERVSERDDLVRTQVAATIDLVRDRGDEALRALTRELDGVTLKTARVPKKLWKAALDELDSGARQALERMGDNLRRVHERALPMTWETEVERGVVVGRRVDALPRVGIYVPGGRAAYPSSLLMAAVPARVAGVEELVVCSPPGPNGLPSPIVLAAAAFAGVDELFAVGGAQAIAALAYGTKEIGRVNRIVGPGNAYVAEAKLQVAGAVGIDAPAGPSELLVLADESADPERVALELLAQAEHDPRACAVAVCTSAEVEAAVAEAIGRLLVDAEREAIIGEALAVNGALLTASIDDAIEFANEYAAEHVLLAAREPEAVFARLRSSGSVAWGDGSSVVFGDYLTGANHVLPTGGSARSFSGLSTSDFIRWTSYQRVSAEGAARLGDDTAVLAGAEGLPAHAAAARRAGGAQ